MKPLIGQQRTHARRVASRRYRRISPPVARLLSIDTARLSYPGACCAGPRFPSR